MREIVKCFDAKSRSAAIMNLLQTLELVRSKEKENGKLLENALLLKRYYDRKCLSLLSGSESYYMPALNAKARIKWTTTFIREMYQHFDLGKGDEGPSVPVFLVTIADKAHLTTAQFPNGNFQTIRQKLSGALQGLHYVGMIEPGYYNVIYDENGDEIKDIVSWHGHFLVWGAGRRKLESWRRKILPRLQRVIPRRCAVHIKQILPEQFGHRLWYINKSPRTEYSVGKRSEPNSVTRLPRYKQNKRELRPGHRVKLFQVLRDVTLPELATAGGEGTVLLRKIKYEALREYCRRNGSRKDRRL
jgi:hypothetical protein